jgi:predicted nucleic acid-binding protein
LKYLLDTCAISELTKLQANSGVIEWLENTNSEDLYLSVINICKQQDKIMNRTQLLNDLEQLPPEAMRQIENFVAFIKTRYQPEYN